VSSAALARAAESQKFDCGILPEFGKFCRGYSARLGGVASVGKAAAFEAQGK
jgi:hypothetical protein